MEKPKSFASKEISRIFDGKIETTQHEIKEVLDIKEIEKWVSDACDYWEDPEDQYYKGIMVDYDNCIYSIDVDRLIDSLEDQIQEWKKEDDEDIVWAFPEKLLKLLNKYKGYIIFI